MVFGHRHHGFWSSPSWFFGFFGFLQIGEITTNTVCIARTNSDFCPDDLTEISEASATVFVGCRGFHRDEVYQAKEGKNNATAI